MAKNYDKIVAFRYLWKSSVSMRYIIIIIFHHISVGIYIVITLKIPLKYTVIT